MMNFENKNVLITAGAGGIGKYIATSFYDSGAKVHIVDINEALVQQMIQSYPEILSTQGDVADTQGVERIFEIQAASIGDVDVLINCAGIAGPTAPVEDVNLEDWHRCLQVNLDATFLCSRKVIPAMKKAREGHIINISSTAGWHGYPLRSPYASAKWAVIGLTKSLAMELGPFGINANVICPGSVDGDRMDRVIAAEALEKGVDESVVRESYTRGCSLRTFISGQDIADMAMFLASSFASKVTGQVMNVDGHLEMFGGLD